MSTLELKKNLKRKIDSIPANKFKKVYGDVINTLNKKTDLDEWSSLPDAEKESVRIGLEQAKQGKVKSHEEVMSRLFTKYGPQK